MANYKREKSEPLEKELKAFYQKTGKQFKEMDDLFEYSEKLGFSVWKLPLDEEKLDGIIVANKRWKKIGLNQSLNLQDARFVLAHELGHYIKKHLSTDEDNLLIAEKDRILHGEDKDDQENDMDYMAAAMLVPQETFIADLRECNFDFDKYVNKEDANLKEPLPENLQKKLAEKYCVDEAVISRRVVEVAYYV